VTDDISIAWAGRAAKAIVLICILVGWVFLSEGNSYFQMHWARGDVSRHDFPDACWRGFVVAGQDSTPPSEMFSKSVPAFFQ